MVKNSKKKVVFLSYSSLDSDYFQIPEIARNLENLPEVKKVFYYKKDSDDDIVDFMEQTLRASDVFVLFCSENSLKSNSVKGEWEAAYQLNKKGLIICLRLQKW